MRQPCVSVVIPVYNAMPFLVECLDSVTGQTLSDIEIICVDDGSTDESSSVLQDYADRDPRIKVLKSEGENSNAGVSRNLGLEAARGDYVIFLDADDFFEPDMLKRSYEKALETSADIVLFNGCKFDQQTKEISQGYEALKTKLLPGKEVFSSRDAASNIFQITSPNPWSKLYRRDYLMEEGIRFQSLPNSNDLYMTFAALASASRICTVNEKFVHYRTNTHSSTQDGKWKNPLCFLEALSKLEKRLMERGLFDIYKASFIECALHHIRYNLNSQKNYDAKLEVMDSVKNGTIIERDLLQEKPDALSKRARTLQKSMNAALAEHDLLLSAQRPKKALTQIIKGNSSQDGNIAITFALIHTGKMEDLGCAMTHLADIDNFSAEILVCCPSHLAAESEKTCLEFGGNSLSSAIVLCEVDSEDVSALRNIAIENAQGEYVYLLDTPRFENQETCLDPEAFGEIKKMANEGAEIDIVWSPQQLIPPTECESKHKPFSREPISTGAAFAGKAFFASLFREGLYDPSPSNYVFRKDLAKSNRISFMEGMGHSEEAFTFYLLAHAQACIVSAKPLLSYPSDPESTTEKPTFSDVYGLCLCAHTCQRLVEDTRLYWDSQEMDAAIRLIEQIYNESVDSYALMPIGERGGRFALPPLEGLIYKQGVLIPALQKKYKKRLDEEKAAPDDPVEKRPSRKASKKTRSRLFHRK